GWIERESTVVEIHEDRVASAQEALPDPDLVTTDPAKMVGVVEDDLSAVGDGGIVQAAIRRDPRGRAGVQLLVASRGPGHRHPDRVLIRLAPLILSDDIDHVELPLVGRVRAFVADLVQDVRKLVDRIDHLPDVVLLEPEHIRVGKRMYLDPFAVVIEVSVDSVDVVAAVEGVTRPRVPRVAILVLDAPTIEQHDRDVDAFVLRETDPLAKPVEVR